LPAPENREDVPDYWQAAGVVDEVQRLPELNSEVGDLCDFAVNADLF
jgi:hypothetical protein